MIIRDSDCVNADLPKFDWTRIAISQVFYLFSISDSWTHSTFLSFQQNIGPRPSLFIQEVFRILGTCKTYCNPTQHLDLTYYQSTPLVKIIFGTPLSFLKCSMYQLSFQHLWMHIIICICIYNVQEFSNILKNFQKTNITC